MAKNGKESKDGFFIRKSLRKNSPSTSQTETSFFVTPKVKEEIAKAKETFKRNLRSTKSAPKEIKEKKPFDKKQWRLQKYSKKYKLEKWEEKRKKSLVNEYYKQIKDEPNTFDVKKIYQQYEEATPDDQNMDQAGPSQTPKQQKQQKRREFRKTHLEFDRAKEEKKLKREEFLKKKAEKDEAIKKYKQNKLEKFKKLNKKTRKGQPIMKYRMEMLLEQIQKSV